LTEPEPGLPGPEPQAASAPVTEQLRALWRELPGLVSDRVELLSLELHRALQALAQIVALLVAMAVLGVTAWLAMWAAIVKLLVTAGMPWAVALLVAIAVNVLAIVAALLRVRSLLPMLKLPATRRHLTVAPDPQPGLSPEKERHERSTAR